jgi:hypothetical protein
MIYTHNQSIFDFFNIPPKYVTQNDFYYMSQEEFYNWQMYIEETDIIHDTRFKYFNYDTFLRMWKNDQLWSQLMYGDLYEKQDADEDYKIWMDIDDFDAYYPRYKQNKNKRSH